jgi:protein SCO1
VTARLHKRSLAILGLAVVAGTLIALARPPMDVDAQAVPEKLRAVMVVPPVKVDFVRLTDQHGNAITADWFTGHWTFLVFGFTSCPDVCPATLAQLAVLKKTIAATHPDVPTPQFVFATVDPERDTQAQLAAYLSNFDPTFVGMTGDPAQIESLERPMGAFHRKGKPSASGYYSVSHSAEIFLLNPAARLYARFVPPIKQEVVADQLTTMVTLYARSVHAETAPSG